MGRLSDMQMFGVRIYSKYVVNHKFTKQPEVLLTGKFSIRRKHMLTKNRKSAGDGDEVQKGLYDNSIPAPITILYTLLVILIINSENEYTKGDGNEEI
jgi:hypothetical protein